MKGFQKGHTAYMGNAFKEGNTFGTLNKGNKRPDLSLLNKSRKGIYLSDEHKKNIQNGGIGKNKGKKRLDLSERNKLNPRRGILSNFWKGGITPVVMQIRGCFKMRQWRSDVFTKDNFTCQDCGVRGGNLEAHHIDRFSDIIKRNNITSLREALSCEELWNINNGQTLCVKCHNKTKTI